jgi:hypothetical protein
MQLPDTPTAVEEDAAPQAATVEGSTQPTHTVDISDYIQIGKQVPVDGIWFRVVKCEGPYVMLRAVGMTSRARRELLNRS